MAPFDDSSGCYNSGVNHSGFKTCPDRSEPLLLGLISSLPRLFGIGS